MHEQSFPISLASVRHCLFPPNDLWRPFPQNQFSNSVHLQIHTNVKLWQIYFWIVDLLHPNSGIHMLSQDVISHRLSPYQARMCLFLPPLNQRKSVHKQLKRSEDHWLFVGCHKKGAHSKFRLPSNPAHPSPACTLGMEHSFPRHYRCWKSCTGSSRHHVDENVCKGVTDCWMI